MAQQLGFEVICEGVETIGQATFLRRANCNFIQGFLAGKPQPARECAGTFEETIVVGAPLDRPAEIETQYALAGFPAASSSRLEPRNNILC